ncbi:MAG: hypothetical protein OHK0056_29030 [Bacteriovoracaceae bacterium]
MAPKESVDQILKDIVVKAAKEYLDAPIPEDKKHLPKTNTQKNIADKTGINQTTLGRYLNPNEAGSTPSLVEAMEILRVMDKRSALLEFPKRSNCHAAKFIKDHYANYIMSHQIEAEVLDVNEEAPLASDVLKIINEHQDRFDKKLLRVSIVLIAALTITSLYNDYKTLRRMDDLRSSINKLIKEIEYEKISNGKN